MDVLNTSHSHQDAGFQVEPFASGISHEAVSSATADSILSRANAYISCSLDLRVLQHGAPTHGDTLDEAQ